MRVMESGSGAGNEGVPVFAPYPAPPMNYGSTA